MSYTQTHALKFNRESLSRDAAPGIVAVIITHEAKTPDPDGYLVTKEEQIIAMQVIAQHLAEQTNRPRLKAAPPLTPLTIAREIHALLQPYFDHLKSVTVEDAGEEATYAPATGGTLAKLVAGRGG